MDPLLVVRQGLLFLHLVAFALAFAEIVRADFRLLRAPRIDFAGLDTSARLVGVALLALWITGLGLVALDTGFDPAAIAAKPKLVAKLIAVTVLTGNGVLLHHYAFPVLRSGARSHVRVATIAALGAVSSVSWTYAAFAGSARLIAGAMSLEGFLLLYGLGLISGIGVAVLVVAPMLRSRLAAGMPRTLRPVDDEAKWSEDREGQPVPVLVEEPLPLRESA
jgi:hypothetical protein